MPSLAEQRHRQNGIGARSERNGSVFHELILNHRHMAFQAIRASCKYLRINDGHTLDSDPVGWPKRNSSLRARGRCKWCCKSIGSDWPTSIAAAYPAIPPLSIWLAVPVTGTSNHANTRARREINNVKDCLFNIGMFPAIPSEAGPPHVAPQCGFACRRNSCTRPVLPVLAIGRVPNPRARLVRLGYGWSSADPRPIS